MLQVRMDPGFHLSFIFNPELSILDIHANQGFDASWELAEAGFDLRSYGQGAPPYPPVEPGHTFGDFMLWIEALTADLGSGIELHPLTAALTANDGRGSFHFRQIVVGAETKRTSQTYFGFDPGQPTSVPEPGSALLLALGICLLVGARPQQPQR